MITFLIKAAQFILALMLLVLLHEVGHFTLSKLFGARVNKFYIFFDWKFSLWKKKIGETEYGVGWIPLGGYCQIDGMIDETQLDKEKFKAPPKPWEFRS
ncbi:MAG: site-2 protease family protein, partial [Prevotella sp.]|nr:site-2 protease family protein [Prevotella sp.]